MVVPCGGPKSLPVHPFNALIFVTNWFFISAVVVIVIYASCISILVCINLNGCQGNFWWIQVASNDDTCFQIIF